MMPAVRLRITALVLAALLPLGWPPGAVTTLRSPRRARDCPRRRTGDFEITGGDVDEMTRVAWPRRRE